MSYELSQSHSATDRQVEYVRLFAQAREQYSEVIRALRAHSEGSAVADIGCGPGSSLRMLSRAGFTTILGFDADRRALRYATHYARRQAIDFIAMPCDLSRGEDSAASALPSGVVQAALATNVAVHVGYPGVFAAAARLLSSGGALAIQDRHYLHLKAMNLPSLEQLASLVRQLVAWDDRDPARATAIGARHGFEPVAGCAVRTIELSGAAVVRPFEFVEAMNGSGDAVRLKAALDEVKRDPRLARARLSVADSWAVYRLDAASR